jgi:hypothetical protein
MTIHALKAHVQEHLSKASEIMIEDDGVTIPTQVLYPSNSAVLVHVTGGRETCRVSDRGGALQTALSHGVSIPNVADWLLNVSKGPMLTASSSGQIVSRELPIGDVASAIALVARASVDAVQYALSHYTLKRDRLLVQSTSEAIAREFGKSNVLRDAHFTGQSNRVYRFDFAVPLHVGRHLLIDNVTSNANSINAKAIAHLDVSRISDSGPIHAIVYDPEEEWNAADINLLSSAAKLLPLKMLANELVKYQKLN